MFNNKKVNELIKENESLYKETLLLRYESMDRCFDDIKFKKLTYENDRLIKENELLKFKVENLEYQNKIYKDILEVK